VSRLAVPLIGKTLRATGDILLAAGDLFAIAPAGFSAEAVD